EVEVEVEAFDLEVDFRILKTLNLTLQSQRPTIKKTQKTPPSPQMSTHSPPRKPHPSPCQIDSLLTVSPT
ncbi:hypothetical protein, partial [Cupriavidus sp. WS]|uniref:hypothetical protein n=1 Tax=Cupriavidus sp. WS TaxID=1312922 RepID=UPI001E57ACB4